MDSKLFIIRADEGFGEKTINYNKVDSGEAGSVE